MFQGSPLSSPPKDPNPTWEDKMVVKIIYEDSSEDSSEDSYVEEETTSKSEMAYLFESFTDMDEDDGDVKDMDIDARDDVDEGDEIMEAVECNSKRHLASESLGTSKRLRSVSSHSKDPEDKKVSKVISEDSSVTLFEDPGDEKESKGISDDSSVISLEPVPLTDMDKDERLEIKKTSELMESSLIVCGPHKRTLNYHNPHEIMLLKHAGFDLGDNSIRVGPVLQVISINISDKLDGSLCNSFEIHGKISIGDYKKNIFTIYQCESDQQEWVYPEMNHLTIDNGWPIAPVMGGKLKFMLTKDGSDQIFKGHYDLYYSFGLGSSYSVSSYSQEKTLTLTGDGYCAIMKYTTTPFAVVAKVDMFCKIVNLPERTVKVYGTIKVNNVVCFEIDDSNPAEMDLGQIYMFFRSRLFAVPVCSPLNVEIEMYSDGKVARYTKKAYPPSLSMSYRPSWSDESWFFFNMDVEWISYDDIFGGKRAYELKNVKWYRHNLLIRQRYMSLVKVTSKHYVEVFSVFVGGGGDSSSATLALHGTIVVQDRTKKVNIFSRKKTCPHEFSSDEQLRTVPLAWPTDGWILLEGFLMHLELMDVHGNRVSWGNLCWRIGLDTQYNRRMCEVIRGKDGYFAAVHYSVFENARKAKVSVEWKGPPSRIYGSIVAGYIGHVYPSAYDKEYYRSIIFKRSVEDGVMDVKYGSEIPLLKSRVSAPSKCKGLNVHVKLLYSLSADSSTQHEICGELPFKARDKNSTEHLGCISVMVDWLK